MRPRREDRRGVEPTRVKQVLRMGESAILGDPVASSDTVTRPARQVAERGDPEPLRMLLQQG